MKNRLLSELKRHARAHSFALYVAALFFISWWPFNFHFESGPIAYVEWPPFKLLLPAYWGDGKNETLKIMVFIPFGMLVAFFSRRQTTGATIIARTVAGSTSLGLLIQIGWFFLPGRSVSASGVVLNIIGAVAGASPVCFRFLSRRILAVLTTGYAMCFLVAATWPWNFSLSAASLPRLYRRIEWMPIHTHLAMWVVKEDTLNTLITLPLGLLVASYILRTGTVRHAIAVAAWLGLGCSTTVEGLQCFLRTRTPSASDLTLNTLGAILGAAVAYYFERSRVSKPHD